MRTKAHEFVAARRVHGRRGKDSADHRESRSDEHRPPTHHRPATAGSPHPTIVGTVARVGASLAVNPSLRTDWLLEELGHLEDVHRVSF